MIITQFKDLSKNGTDWTNAFAEALAALKAQGGGELSVPAGLYPTGSIRLYSHITLRVEAGATLRFHDDPGMFPVIDGEFEGIPAPMYQSCIQADDAENVKLCGDGTLDGNGAAWWQAKHDGALAHPRPYLVHFRHCDRVIVEGVQLINSPCWTVHPMYCRDVTIRGIRIVNPADSPNTDGIDPNGCNHVRISDCFIDVGDDCIAIKSGTEDTPNPRPCENIIITNCSMAHGHGGVVIGSEMSGGVRNVLVSGCVMQHTDRGIRLKTRRGRGGMAQNLQFSNILMEDVACPFVMNMYYFCGKDGKTPTVRDKSALPVNAGTPAICDVRVSQVTVRGATACAGFFYGLAEQPIERVSLSDCTVEMVRGKASHAAMLDDIDPMEAHGLFLRNVKGLTLRNMQVIGTDGPEIDTDDSVSM